MIAVFLDRDGTIGGDGGGVHPLVLPHYMVYLVNPKENTDYYKLLQIKALRW